MNRFEVILSLVTADLQSHRIREVGHAKTFLRKNNRIFFNRYNNYNKITLQ